MNPMKLAVPLFAVLAYAPSQVFAVPGPEWFGADGPAVAQMLNDFVAGVVRQHPTRFFGLCVLPLQDMRASLTELDRCVRRERASLEVFAFVEGDLCGRLRAECQRGDSDGALEGCVHRRLQQLGIWKLRL